MAKPIPAKQDFDGPKGHGGADAPLRVFTRSAIPFRRVPVYVECLESEDRTQQAFRDECDINVLMKRYEKTGILPQGRNAVPQFLDVSGLDFVDSANRVAEVRGVFSQLDAHTRARFANDPALMLEFLSDPSNHAEAVKLGLMPKEVEGGSDEDVARTRGAGQAGGPHAAADGSERGTAAADRGAPSGASQRPSGGPGGAGEAGGEGKSAVK